MEDVRESPPDSFLASFASFVLSTCSPSHVRAARKGVDDWVAVNPGSDYVSPSTGLTHRCDDSCQAWVLRVTDGVKVCAISGRCIVRSSSAVAVDSPLKRGRDGMVAAAAAGAAAAAAAAASSSSSSPAFGMGVAMGGSRSPTRTVSLGGGSVTGDDDELEPGVSFGVVQWPGGASPESQPKRHQEKPIPGSSAALAEKFGEHLSAAAYCASLAPVPASAPPGGSMGGAGAPPSLRLMTNHNPLGLNARTPAPTPRSPPKPPSSSSSASAASAAAAAGGVVGWASATPNGRSPAFAAAAALSPLPEHS